MKNLTCVWRNIYNTARATHSRYYKHFAKHASDFLLILLEPCNFLYKFIHDISIFKSSMHNVYFYDFFGDFLIGKYLLTKFFHLYTVTLQVDFTIICKHSLTVLHSLVLTPILNSISLHKKKTLA